MRIFAPVTLVTMVASATVLSARETAINYAAAGAYPTNYDQIVRTHLEDILRDPSSADVHEKRRPRLGAWFSGGGLLTGRRKGQPFWFVCYKINAKNAYGGYVGFKDYLFLIANGEVAGERSSPYFNQYSSGEIEDPDVAIECSRPADALPPVTQVR